MYKNPRLLWYPKKNTDQIALEQVPVIGVPLVTNPIEPLPPLSTPSSETPLPPPNYPAFSASNITNVNSTSYTFFDTARQLRFIWDDNDDMTLRVLYKDQYGKRVSTDLLIPGASEVYSDFYASQILSMTPTAFAGGPDPASKISVGLGIIGQTRFWQFDVTRPFWGATVEVYLAAPAVGWDYSIYSTNSQISWPSVTQPGTITSTTGFFEYGQSLNLTNSSYTVIESPVTNLWVQCAITDEEATPDIEFTVIILQQGV